VVCGLRCARARGGFVSFRPAILIALVALAASCAVSTQPLSGTSAPPPADDVEASPSSPREDPGDVDEDPSDAKPKPDVEPESTTPGDILGTLSGSCGIVKTQLAKPTSTLVQNQLTFVAGETYDKASLSPDGQIMFDTPNAGGSSSESEVMSLEVLHACEGAKLLKTETQVKYVDDAAGPPTITDILVEIGGKRVGVSVTRAYKPQNQPFPDSEVKSLLEKKLEGILRSSARVAPTDKWVKQILHVFAANKAQADAVARVLPTIDASIRSNTIVLLTQTTGGGFVYCNNPDPPLGSECP
jgi:hypothetical protein